MARPIGQRGKAAIAVPRMPAPASAARTSRHGDSGFTLIELLVAIALVAIVVALGVPSYRDWIAAYELANASEQLVASLGLARAEAIKRGGRVSLCPAAEGSRCGEDGGWDRGWLVFVDSDRDGRRADDEPVLRVARAAAAGIRVRANRPVRDYVSFTGLGNARLVSGGLQMGTFTLCRPGVAARKVVLANGGRVRMEVTSDGCVD